MDTTWIETAEAALNTLHALAAEPELVAHKVTLWDLPPFSGSITTTLDDPLVDRLLVQGWVVVRTWTAHITADGRKYVTDDSGRRVA